MPVIPRAKQKQLIFVPYGLKKMVNFTEQESCLVKIKINSSDFLDLGMIHVHRYENKIDIVQIMLKIVNQINNIKQKERYNMSYQSLFKLGMDYNLP